MANCNFCSSLITPDNKGASNDIGYIICHRCIILAQEAINDSALMNDKVIYLKSYAQNKAFSK